MDSDKAKKPKQLYMFDRVQLFLKWIIVGTLIYSIIDKIFLFFNGLALIISGKALAGLGATFLITAVLSSIIFAGSIIGVLKNKRWGYYLLIFVILTSLSSYLNLDNYTRDPFILIIALLQAMLASAFITRENSYRKKADRNEPPEESSNRLKFGVVIITVLIFFGAEFLSAKFTSVPAPVEQALMNYRDDLLDDSSNSDNLLFFEKSVKEIIREKIDQAILTGDAKRLAEVVELDSVPGWIKYKSEANNFFQLPEDFKNVDLVTGEENPFDPTVGIHVFVWPEALLDGQSALIKIESADLGSKSNEKRKMRQPTRVMPDGKLHFAMEVEPKLGCRIDFLVAETKSLVFDTCGLSDEVVYEIINLAVIESGE